MKSSDEWNASINGARMGSESSSTINRRSLLKSTVDDRCRILSTDKKRAHFTAFVRKIIVITAKTTKT